MSQKTGIQWTDATWNPVVGCERVSPGCDNCYAKSLHDMRHKARLAGKRVLPLYDKPFEDVQLRPHKLTEPMRWQEPRRVFVNSMSDLFHKDVPESFLDECFAMMAGASRHTFQVLTKRPHRMRPYVEGLADRGGSGRGFRRLVDAGQRVGGYGLEFQGIPLVSWPIPNIWLGVSTENQECADKRIPLLLQTPAAVRFLSCEPLLGPLDLSRYLPSLDWVIVGGESGTSARTSLVYWYSQIIDQCEAAGVPVFVKQFGRWIEGGHEGFIVNRWLFGDGRAWVPPIIGPNTNKRPDGAIAFGLGDTHGGTTIEWPERFRLRQFPKRRTELSDRGDANA